MGVEFASIFNSFGTQVTVLEMLPRVTPIEDDEISAELEKALKKKGIEIFTEAKVETVKKDSQGATVAFTDKDGKTQSISAERVLMAVGRLPKTENLGPGKIESETRARVCPRRPVHGNGRAAPLRDRRHRRRDAAARARRVDGGHHLRRENHGQADASDREDSHPQRHLLRAPGGVDRLDRARGARGGLRGQNRENFRSLETARRRSWATTKASSKS